MQQQVTESERASVEWLVDGIARAGVIQLEA